MNTLYLNVSILNEPGAPYREYRLSYPDTSASYAAAGALAYTMQPAYPVDGVVTFTGVPACTGAQLQAGGRSYTFDVVDSGSPQDLSVLMKLSTEYPPPAVLAAQSAALAAQSAAATAAEYASITSIEGGSIMPGDDGTLFVGGSVV